MKPLPRYPSLFQINTRVWLTELGNSLRRPATLDDIPDSELDGLAEKGFDWVWLLSVWQTGAAAQKISRSNPEWRNEFQQTLPDLREEDIGGSGFAITRYTVSVGLGGDAALARLRERLSKRDLRLMLDFVPNHMAPDHPWVEQHPDYFIQGGENDLANSPQNYFRTTILRGPLVLAYGRDPYFPGWPDTVQLDYSNPATQEAMTGELAKIARQCDGVRCDMAMLVLSDVFERTWGRRAPLFWPNAIKRVRESVPAFCFMAEVYWDLEWTMQQQSVSATACARDALARCVNISMPGLTTKTNSHVSWKTTTNRGPPRHLHRRFTELQRSSRSYRWAYASFIKVSSKGGRIASRRIWSARRRSPSKNRSKISMNTSWRCSGNPAFAMASGAFSSACRRGMAI